MWSDRTPPEVLRTIVRGVQSVLPPPRPAASLTRRRLPGTASIEQLAEVLRRNPGFVWLNSGWRENGASLPCLLHQPLAAVTYWDGYATVTGPGGAVRLDGQGFHILSAIIEAWQGPSGALLAGFLSYDLAPEIEDLGPPMPQTFRFPKFHFGLYDSALVFEGGHWIVHATDAWRTAAPSAADWIAAANKIQVRVQSEQGALGGTLNSWPDRGGFESAVGRTVTAIHAGDIFQTNLCRSIETTLAPDQEWELYRRMRSISPARYEAFLQVDPQRAVFSISPELFLKVERGLVESAPIKGTRPRGSSEEEDARFVRELLASVKDRAELAMIVDVTRNDLGRVCETGSVTVTGHAELMSLPTVHHLFSTVQGRLRAGAGTVELLRAAFPAASITGAPKIEAMRIAMRQEGQWRGPCMGSIGWIALDGDMELSVAIRTAFSSEGHVRHYAACRITADSNPAEEFRETQHKAAAFVRALGGEPSENW